MIASVEAECMALYASLSSLKVVGTPRYRLMNKPRTLDTLPLRDER